MYQIGIDTQSVISDSWHRAQSGGQPRLFPCC
jgi:hypothetical protein